jgi:hypothetical protein
MPSNGSPEQVAAAFETLDAVRERVWGLYGQRNQQVLRKQEFFTASPAPCNIDEADVSF